MEAFKKDTKVPLLDNRMLIKHVQMYEMLYVGNHPKYSDSRCKEEVWETVASQMNLPVSLCKRSWFNLRDSYRRALRKRRDALIDGLPYRKWRYEDEMEFLAPHIAIRDPNDRILPDSFVEAVTHTEMQTPPKSFTTVDSEEKSETTSIEPKAKRKRERKLNLNQLLPREPNNYQPFNYNMDHIDAFLMGIGATMRNFTARNQNLAKAKIFALISEMEMHQITEYKIQNETALRKRGNHEYEGEACDSDKNDENDDEEDDTEVYDGANYPAVCIDEKEDDAKSKYEDEAKVSEKDSTLKEPDGAGLISNSKNVTQSDSTNLPPSNMNVSPNNEHVNSSHSASTFPQSSPNNAPLTSKDNFPATTTNDSSVISANTTNSCAQPHSDNMDRIPSNTSNSYVTPSSTLTTIANSFVTSNNANIPTNAFIPANTGHYPAANIQNNFFLNNPHQFNPNNPDGSVPMHYGMPYVHYPGRP